MALLSVSGQDIGKVYPGIQSGTAVFTAGVAVVQFPRAFGSVPQVVATAYSVGGATAIPWVIPSGVTTTQASLTGWEINGAGAGTISGTLSAGTVNWLAYAVGRGN